MGAGENEEPGLTPPIETTIPPLSLKDYDADFGGFSARLGRSFERFGFAVVSDHGLPDAMVEGCAARAKAFFALPEAVKQRYVIPGGGGQRGYTPFGIETAKDAAHEDLKAFWHVGRDLPPDHPGAGLIAANTWPGEIEGFRDAALGLYAGLEALGLRLLRAIARSLDLADDFFDAKVAGADSILRLLHYPPTTSGAAGLRASPHEDINVITLLLGAEEAGLQILDREGRWLAVNPPPGSVVVNIGDMLQRLTNDRLPSTTHRVVNPTPERRGVARYSMPFFLHFAPDYRIETLAACITPDRPNRYPDPITSRDFLMRRLSEIKLV
jgi:isopenicillin N synthase-like dioxygenase